MPWPVGNSVVVHGLTSEQGRQLNGRQGVIQGNDLSTGRLMISFGTGSSLDPPSSWKKINPWNVRFHRTFAVDALQPHRLANTIGSEIWSHVLSYAHIGTWHKIGLAAPMLHAAADLAAVAAPYDGSCMVANVTCPKSSALWSSALWLRRTGVRAVDFEVPTNLRGCLAEHLPLLLERLVLRSPSLVGLVSLGNMTFAHLLHLDIVNAHPTWRKSLLECSMPQLLELRVGLPISLAYRSQHEDLLDAIGSLGHLVALDIGYLRTMSGVDQCFWQPLFAQRNLRALDFSMVMRWMDFDAPLECITDHLQLESLAIHGLRFSNTVFKRFCETCPLRHLRIRNCNAHGGLLAPVYTACRALEFADFAGSQTILSSSHVISLRSWLEAQQPKRFLFTGLVPMEDAGALPMARNLAAAFEDMYDFCICAFSSDPTRIETLDGVVSPASYLLEHGDRCWGAGRRFFDIMSSVTDDNVLRI